MKQISSSLIGIDEGDDVLFSDYEVDGEMWTGTGPRERRHSVRFRRAFRGEPTVFAALTMWDIADGANARADVTAENITAKGCDVVFRTWGDTRVARARVRWMAIGALPNDDDWDVI